MNSISTVFARAAQGRDTVEVGAHRWPVPKSVAHLCEPASILSTIHGLVAGEAYCPCGHPTETASRCTACGRPYQRRCATDGCDEWVQPARMTGSGWYEPTSQCSKCTQKRELSLKNSRVSRIPAQIREHVGSYEVREGRLAADRALYDWLESDLDTCVWLSGPRKAGKTTAVARAAVKAVYTDLVGTLMWLEYEDLVSAAKRCYTDDGSKQWKLIDKAINTDLLVLDDVFPRTRRRPDGKILGVEGLSGHVAGTMCDVLRRRFMSRRPTLLTSVHSADWAIGHLGEHVLGWWEGVGTERRVE